MKKILLSFVLLALFAPSLSFAAKSVNPVGGTTDTTCIRNAVATRESSIISAFSKFNTSMVSALEKRKTGLSTAWSKTEVSERKATRKSTWDTFKSDRKSASSTYKSDKKTAWSTFTNTMTSTCMLPKSVVEETEKTSEEPTL